ncbi:hypothetical protein H310_12698 [Aphanomyces invadans]|uniref:Uncharacterized protein n=1 Tax=Aphanomyces invadans TaxID=157072 RepID=A0A024TGT2_9STRA|nr:hypothetical protein H310_12698 [Aphanomyces invadans]ETV93263.1 hypothetical protein H310_12698 [Aphanomyces invadans]|eukprot:XP_008878098.1 hypothetical protein H310_12698 [Aphanomyces invadans]
MPWRGGVGNAPAARAAARGWPLDPSQVPLPAGEDDDFTGAATRQELPRTTVATASQQPSQPQGDQNDVDMGEDVSYVCHAPVIPQAPSFSGSTKQEHRVLMRAYQSEISTGQPRDLDILKRRLEATIRFDTKILDADSRVGEMLDGLMRALERHNQEWVLKDEGKVDVDLMVKVVRPSMLQSAIKKQMQLQVNKPLRSDVLRFVNWLRIAKTLEAMRRRGPTRRNRTGELDQRNPGPRTE